MLTLILEVEHDALRLGTLRWANGGKRQRLVVFLWDSELVFWGLVGHLFSNCAGGLG